MTESKYWLNSTQCTSIINCYFIYIYFFILDKVKCVLLIQGVKNSVYKLWGVVEEIKWYPFVMWQISDRFSVSSLVVLEGFDAGWFDCIQPAVWWMSYRIYWKYRPFTLMYIWHLRANDSLTRSKHPGVSRIIPAASATRATSSSGVSIGVSYTKRFISPWKEIHRSEIGRMWWPLYWINDGETLFRYSLTSRAKCAGAPSCRNHNRCLTCSGTFSNISCNMSRIKIM